MFEGEQRFKWNRIARWLPFGLARRGRGASQLSSVVVVVVVAVAGWL